MKLIDLLFHVINIWFWLNKLWNCSLCLAQEMEWMVLHLILPLESSYWLTQTSRYMHYVAAKLVNKLSNIKFIRFLLGQFWILFAVTCVLLHRYQRKERFILWTREMLKTGMNQPPSKFLKFCYRVLFETWFLS